MNDFICRGVTKLKFKGIAEWKHIGGNNMDELTNPKTPFSRPLLVQLRTLLKSQDPENQTLFRGTYPFRPDQGVPPGLLSH